MAARQWSRSCGKCFVVGSTPTHRRAVVRAHPARTQVHSTPMVSQVCRDTSSRRATSACMQIYVRDETGESYFASSRSSGAVIESKTRIEKISRKKQDE